MLELKDVRSVRMAAAGVDITQTELARLVGISEPHMSRVLHGKRNFTPLLRIKIERAIEDVERQRAAEAERPAPTPRVRRLR